MKAHQQMFVLAQHIFASDRELKVPYIFNGTDQVNFANFTQTGQFALASLALLNQLRSNSGIVNNDCEIDSHPSLLQLVYGNNPELHSPDSNEFVYPLDVKATMADAIKGTATLCQCDQIALNQQQINEVVNLQADLKNAVKIAAFSNHVLLTRNQDFMDPEKIGENTYLFDTVAYLGKMANISVDGIDLIVSYAQTCRLTCSCSADKVSSIVVDDVCFDDLSDERNWIILAQNPKLHSEQEIQPQYEHNGEIYFEIELYEQDHINSILNDVSASIGFPSTNEINTLLDSIKERIFEKSKDDLHRAIQW